MRASRALGAALLAVALGVPLASPAAAYDDIQVTLAGPKSVAGGSTISLTGSVTSNGTPVGGGEVVISYGCEEPIEYFVVAGSAVTNASGEYAFDFQAGACTSYRFAARYDAANGSWNAAQTYVDVTRTQTLLVLDPGEGPWIAFTFDDFSFVARLTQMDGTPIADAQINVHRYGNGVPDRIWAVTTDASGSVVVHDSVDLDGDYYYSAYYPGTPLLDDVASNNLFTYWIVRRPSTLTLDGPSIASMDEPVEVTGQLTGPQSPAPVTVTGPGGNSTTVSTELDGTFRATIAGSVGGNGSWTAKYNGDDHYEPASAWAPVVIPKLVTEIVLSGPEDASARDLVTLTGQLVGVDAPATVMLNGMFEIHTGADGSFATSAYSSIGGDATYNFAYQGDARHAGSSNSVTVHFARLATSILLDPQTSAGGNPSVLTGSLVGAGEGQKVYLDVESGTYATSTTGQNGTFALNVPYGSDYTVRYDGNPTFMPTSVHVERVHPTASVSVDLTDVTVGHTSVITVRTIANASRHVIVTGYANSAAPLTLFDGYATSDIVLRRTFVRSTRLVVDVPSDPFQTSATASTEVQVRPRLTEKALHPVTRVNRYAVYRRGAAPVFRARSYPARTGECLWHLVQRYTHGAWGYAGQSGCRPQDDAGRSLWRFRGGHSDSKYRINVSYNGGLANSAGYSAWTYFRFR